MRICPKCLTVYSSCADVYCRNDGSLTHDTVSKEGQKAIRKLKVEGELKDD